MFRLNLTLKPFASLIIVALTYLYYFYVFYLMLTHSFFMACTARCRWISVCPAATTRTVCRCRSWAATTPWPAAAATNVMRMVACPDPRTTRLRRWPSARPATWGRPCRPRPTTAVHRLTTRPPPQQPPPLLTITIRRPSTDTIRTTTRTTNTTWTAQTPQVRTFTVICHNTYIVGKYFGGL